jgi:hypothetical protein
VPVTGKGDGGIYGCLVGVWIERVKVADLPAGHATWWQDVDPGRESGADADLGIVKMCGRARFERFQNVEPDSAQRRAHAIALKREQVSMDDESVNALGAPYPPQGMSTYSSKSRSCSSLNRTS